MNQSRRDFLRLAGMFGLTIGGAAVMSVNPSIVFAQAGKKNFKIAWSHYTGWEPWELARKLGVLKKWADKYGITIELSPPMDYLESINQYTSGAYDGCVMTNMDMLINPAQGGVDSTALIIGDYSNGNDGVVAKKAKAMIDLRGRKINLPVGSVSHYLLNRALVLNGMTVKNVRLENTTSESDLITLFETDPNAAVVAWNPPLMSIRNKKDANLLFDSSKIPGEILDLMVVRTDSPDALKRALTGAWYETMVVMSGKDNAAKDAIQYMAKFAGASEGEFLSQLKTTAMMYAPAEAVAFAENAKLRETMDYVRTFCFEQGLMGKAKSKDEIGIAFPDGSVLGNKDKVKLRFDVTYMKMAASGQL